LDLANNQLCGLDYMYGEGTYDASGITALAEALKVNAVLTDLNLADNNLTNNGKDMTGIHAIAEALKSGTAVLTSLDLSSNSIGGHYEDDGYDSDEDEMQRLFVPEMSGITALASALRVNVVLKKCDVRSNKLGDAGEQMLRDAVKGRKSFELLV